MFQNIHYTELEYNTLYKIGDSYKGIYKGKICVFHYSHDYYDWIMKLEFDNVRDLENKPVTDTIFPVTTIFSKFCSTKEKNQTSMEHRAINLILRKWTGDNTFSWF